MLKGHKFSAEHKRNLSIAHIGKKHSEETKNKQSKTHKERGTGKWMKGRHPSEETRKKIGDSNIGRPNGMLGKKHTEEWKRKMSLKMKGRKHSEETKLKMSLAQKGTKRIKFTPERCAALSRRMKGRVFSKESIQKMREAQIGKMTGAKCHFWKGGISDLNVKIRGHWKYRQWRSDVFTRDNFICQQCGIRSGCGHTVFFEAHHLKSLASIIEDNNIKTIEDAINCEELWNINNGITLCAECHRLTDNYAGRNLRKADINKIK
jgi:hypothetical protein